MNPVRGSLVYIGAKKCKVLFYSQEKHLSVGGDVSFFLVLKAVLELGIGF